MNPPPLDRLRSMRASLEALAEVMATMEEDFRSVAAEFDEAAGVCATWMASVLESREEDLAAEESSGGKDAAAGAGTRTIRVLLASKSQNRRALIGSALPRRGFVLANIPPLNPDIDEKAPELRPEGISAEELVLRIANAKADRAVEMLKSRGEEKDVDVVVCADQVVKFRPRGGGALNDEENEMEIREKPRDSEEAISHLMSYGETGNPAICVTGVVAVCLRTGRRFEGVDVATQEIKKMTREQASGIWKTGDITESAGSFSVESRAMRPFLGETKGEIESVRGMPMKLTRRLMLSAAKETLVGSIVPSVDVSSSKRTRVT